MATPSPGHTRPRIACRLSQADYDRLVALADREGYSSTNLLARDLLSQRAQDQVVGYTPADRAKISEAIQALSAVGRNLNMMVRRAYARHQHGEPDPFEADDWRELRNELQGLITQLRLALRLG